MIITKQRGGIGMHAVVSDFQKYKECREKNQDMYIRPAEDRQLRRRRREVRRAEIRRIRRKKAVLIAAVLLIVFISIFTALAAKKTEAVGVPLYKYYTTVEADRGDSLWSIASDYMTPGYKDCGELIDEIMAVNHLQGESIDVGQKLIVPYYSSEYKD